jgi:hypothetical protein
MGTFDVLFEELHEFLLDGVHNHHIYMASVNCTNHLKTPRNTSETSQA